MVPFSEDTLSTNLFHYSQSIIAYVMHFPFSLIFPFDVTYETRYLPNKCLELSICKESIKSSDFYPIDAIKFK